MLLRKKKNPPARHTPPPRHTHDRGGAGREFRRVLFRSDKCNRPRALSPPRARRTNSLPDAAAKKETPASERLPTPRLPGPHQAFQTWAPRIVSSPALDSCGSKSLSSFRKQKSQLL